MDARTRSNNYSMTQGLPFFFSAEDIRQYAYCPRKIYFRYVIRNDWLLSPKMVRGVELHERLCRGKEKDVEEDIVRYYNLRLEDRDLGLFALLDIVEWDGQSGKVIELKTSKHKKGDANFPDKLQVVAEAILVELSLNIPVERGAIWYYNDNEIVEFEITDNDRLKVLGILKDMRKIVENEVFPKMEKPTKKCRDCECRKLCWWL